MAEHIESINHTGLEVLKLFKQAKGLNAGANESSVRWLQAAISTESDRFELWSVNLGLFVSGHGSLDYRLRQADSLRTTVKTFLGNLELGLKQVLEYYTSQDNVSAGASSQPLPSDDPDDDVFEDDGNLEEFGSDTELLLDGIKDPIDRLYKVSIWIRNPSSRHASSKALQHQEIDAETGVDLLQAVTHFDHDYVSSLFRQYRKSKAFDSQSESGTPEPRGESDEQARRPMSSVHSEYQSEQSSQIDSFLVLRVAHANKRRRQQFAHWRRHRDKLDRHSTLATQHTKENFQPYSVETLQEVVPNRLNPKATEPEVLSVTTATHLQISQLTINDNESHVSTSEYAPSLFDDSKEVVDFPPAPKRPSADKFFECPYCFTLCPRATLGVKSWKAHLIHDLRPYICTYESCTNADQLYDTRRDWIRHENTHRKAFRCQEHTSQVFVTSQDFEFHLESTHGAHDRESLRTLGKYAGDPASTAPDRDCPVCLLSLGSLRMLQNHIALHLERFSLFSLPRDVEGDQAEREEADSIQVNSAAGDSRAEDFAKDLVSAEDSDSETSTLDDPAPSEGASKSNAEEQAEVPSRSLEDDSVQKTIHFQEQIVRKKQFAFPEDDPDRLVAELELAIAYKDCGLMSEAMKLLEHVVEVQRVTLAGDYSDLLASEYELAKALQAEGEMKGAIMLFEIVVAMKEKLLGKDHPETLPLQHDLAVAYRKNRQIKASVELLEQIFETRIRVLGVEHPNTLRSQHDLAISFQLEGHFKESIKLLEQVISVQEKVLAEDNPERLSSLEDLSATYNIVEQHGRAIELLEQAVEIRRKYRGEEHYKTLVSQRRLAREYRLDGQLERSCRLLEKVVAVQERVLAEDDPKQLSSLEDLAVAYSMLEQHGRAIELLEQVVETEKKFGGEEHYGTLVSQRRLAVEYRLDGQLERSCRLLEQVVAAQEGGLAENDPDRLGPLQDLALVYGLQGQKEREIRLLEHVVDLREGTLPENHPVRLESQKLLLSAYKADGREERAARLAETIRRNSEM